MSTKVTIGTEITAASEAIRVAGKKLLEACNHLTSAAQISRRLEDEALAVQISSQVETLVKTSTATTPLLDELLRLANVAHFRMKPQEKKRLPIRKNTTHLRRVK